MIDRNKFKGTKTSVVKAQIKEGDALSPYKGSTDFHKIEEGVNVHRIAPAHDSKHSAYELRRTSTLKVDMPVLDDDGKETSEKKEKLKPIFIATTHGGLSADPIELYIQAVRQKVADENSNKDEVKKILGSVTGYRNRDGKWIWGILPNIGYICYSWKNIGDKKILGRFELNQTVTRKMDELNISEETNKPMEVDIFSDPNEGSSVIITYDKSKKGGDKYAVKVKAPPRGRGVDYQEFLESERVTDAQLEELDKKDPLYDMYNNVYKKRDWDLAIAGLTKFDKVHGFNVFDNEEFVDELNKLEEELMELLKERGDGEEDNSPAPAPTKKEESTKRTPRASKKAPVPAAGSGEFDTFTPRKLKNYLTAYMEEEEYNKEFILPNLEKEDLIKWCELAKAQKDLPFTDADKVVKKEQVLYYPDESAKEDIEVPESEETNGDLDSQINDLINDSK